MVNRNFLYNVAHKVIGARGSTSFFTDQFGSRSRPTSSNFGKIYPEGFQEMARQHRLIFFGEIHSQPSIVACQCALLQEMCMPSVKSQEISLSTLPSQSTTCDSSSILHVVMEHFSFEMQSMLDSYLRDGTISSFDEFEAKYHEIGTEGHDLEAYRPLLEFARENSTKIRIHAGFLPRKYARILMREGPEVALEKVSHWLPKSIEGEADAVLRGSNLHYNIFESLISGRSPYPKVNEMSMDGHNDENASPPDDRFRGIFMAQVLKDVAMAHKINQLLEQNKGDKILVIAGNGHVLHYCGVPERVLQAHPEIADETCVVACAPVDASGWKLLNTEGGESSDVTILQHINGRFGREGTNPADYLYFYKSDNMPIGEDVKSETQAPSK